MGVLLMDDTILEPDLALDLGQKTFEVQMLIDTDDAWEATRIGDRAMRKAFGVAGILIPDRSKVFIHKDLLNTRPVFVETSLVTV